MGKGNRWARPARSLLRLGGATGLLTVVATGLSPASSGAATSYSVRDLGALNGAAGLSQAFGVNVADEVVGYSTTVSTSPYLANGPTHAFSWTATGGMVDLGTLGGTSSDSSAANGVNDSGEVVGWSSTGTSGSHAFSYTPSGGMVDLGTLGGTSGTAEAVNDDGEVVGYSTTSGGDTHAFSYSPSGGMVDLGTLGGSTSEAFGVNAGGEVVGWSTTATGQTHAFTWTAGGGMTDLAPSSSASAYGVNGNGEVVGDTFAAMQHAMYDTGSGIVDIGSLGGPFTISSAAGVNDGGTIVGASVDSTYTNQPFVWTSTDGVVALPLPPGGYGGWAQAVNSGGSIVGTENFTANFQPGQHAALWLPGAPPPPDGDLALQGVPSNMSVAATGASGAVVSYTAPTAVDGDDAGSVTVACTPASGSVFALGQTKVVCTATDPDDTDSPVSASFTVTVTDQDLALSGVPGPITADATSPAGAVVSYVLPRAVDDESAAATVSCAPAPGSTFAVGTSTVTCAAMDADDANSPVSAGFTVTVLGADAQLAALEQQVQAVAPGSSLYDTVTSAQAQFDARHLKSACNDMVTFVSEVQAQAGKKLTAAQVSAFVSAATTIEGAMGCGS